MTALAVGASVTVSVRDGGTVAISTNGGSASALVATTEGGSSSVSIGPLPERRTLGPYAEGASIVLTNANCGSFDYDVETRFDPSSVAITGGVIGGGGVASLVRPGNLDIAFVGDSRTEQNWTSSIVKASNGVAYWVETLSLSGARCPNSYNFGTTGFTSAQVLATHIPSAVACGAATVVYHASTNDRTSLTLDQTIANTLSSVALLLNAGKCVVLVCETPRGTPFALSGDQLGYHVAYRDWCKDLAARYPSRIKTIDVWPAWIDPSTGALASGKTVDGLHQSPAGAYDIGLKIARAHDTLFAPMDYVAAMNGGAYSANNQRGNLLSNGTLTGTGGTNSGTPAPTGNVAPFCTIDSLTSTGLTITNSKVTTSGIEMQQIVVGGTGSTGTPQVQVRQNVGAPSNAASGDVLEAFAYVEVDAGQTALQGIRLTATVIDDSGTRLISSGERNTGGSHTTNAWSGVIRTDRFTVSGACTTLQQSLNIMVAQSVTAAITVRTRGWVLRKVIGF